MSSATRARTRSANAVLALSVVTQYTILPFQELMALTLTSKDIAAVVTPLMVFLSAAVATIGYENSIEHIHFAYLLERFRKKYGTDHHHYWVIFYNITDYIKHVIPFSENLLLSKVILAIEMWQVVKIPSSLASQYINHLLDGLLIFTPVVDYVLSTSFLEFMKEHVSNEIYMRICSMYMFGVRRFPYLLSRVTTRDCMVEHLNLLQMMMNTQSVNIKIQGSMCIHTLTRETNLSDKCIQMVLEWCERTGDDCLSIDIAIWYPCQYMQFLHKMKVTDGYAADRQIFWMLKMLAYLNEKGVAKQLLEINNASEETRVMRTCRSLSLLKRL